MSSLKSCVTGETVQQEKVLIVLQSSVWVDMWLKWKIKQITQWCLIFIGILTLKWSQRHLPGVANPVLREPQCIRVFRPTRLITALPSNSCPLTKIICLAGGTENPAGLFITTWKRRKHNYMKPVCTISHCSKNLVSLVSFWWRAIPFNCKYEIN